MKIYTRTGDKGKTSLIGGTRVFKNEPRIEAYGTVDELNSCVGLARSFLNQIDEKQIKSAKPSRKAVDQWLEFVQHQLFNIGSQLACEDPEVSKNLPPVSAELSNKLEGWIEECNTNLPELKNFILPGGHPAASQLHICRTVCRRGERLIVEINEAEAFNEIVMHLNRLSDFFFVVARYANFLASHEDVIWQQDTSEDGASS